MAGEFATRGFVVAVLKTVGENFVGLSTTAILTGRLIAAAVEAVRFHGVTSGLASFSFPGSLGAICHESALGIRTAIFAGHVWRRNVTTAVAATRAVTQGRVL